MPREVERKFLVTGDGWRERVTRRKSIRQIYLARTHHAEIRVRIVDGTQATLTVKSATSQENRAEFEYPIPVEDAEALFELAESGTLEKCRHILPATGGAEWEIDEFGGRHDGLVLAEIELGCGDEDLLIPDWCGEEVTGNARYYNANLAAT